MPTTQEIQTCINNLDSNSNVTDLVVLAAQTNDATTNRAISVAQTCDLPDLASVAISPGTVFFVQSLGVPVVAGIGSWLGMDNHVLRQDYPGGIIWSWGCNGVGRLGDGTTTNRSSPVIVAGGFTDWRQVSAGRVSTVAVKTNGTAWTWGCNGVGGLGNNSTVDRSSPVLVTGGFTDWCQVAMGYRHGHGVRTTGSLWSWGYNGSGQLGDNTTANKSSPVSLIGGFTDWCQVTASGSRFALAIRQNGTLWSWGYGGSFGQLGQNCTTNRSSPVSVVGGFTDWCQVSTFYQHVLAVRQNGTLWSWGNNQYCRLGDGGATNRSSPGLVGGGFTDWCQASAGRAQSLAIRTNGSAWAWGLNTSGQLGINDLTTRASPVQVCGGFTDWCQGTVGIQHSLAVRQNGTAWAWGVNGGSFGDNTTTNRCSPVEVAGGFTNWCQVSTGFDHSTGIIRY